jgi:hypothetical protein
VSWITRKVRLGCMSATQAVVSTEGGVIAWCEGLEDAQQVAGALNDHAGAVEALEAIRDVVGEMEASDTHTPYNLSRLGVIRAHVARALEGHIRSHP